MEGYKKWANKADGRIQFFKEWGFHDITISGIEADRKGQDFFVEYSIGWGNPKSSPAEKHRDKRTGLRNLDGSMFDASKLKKMLGHFVETAQGFDDQPDGKARFAEKASAGVPSICVGGAVDLDIGSGQTLFVAHYTVDWDGPRTADASQVRIYRWVRNLDGSLVAGTDKTVELLK